MALVVKKMEAQTKSKKSTKQGRKCIKTSSMNNYEKRSHKKYRGQG